MLHYVCEFTHVGEKVSVFLSALLYFNKYYVKCGWF
jgi:hypothetical protein